MRDRTFINHIVRITVVKVACYTDLGEKYTQYRPGADRGTVVPCNFFKEGMTFTVQLDPFGNCKPEGFCDEVWKAIYQYAFALAHGAGQDVFYYGDWIRKPGVAICCCNDGLRPVLFKLEATDEESRPD